MNLNNICVLALTIVLCCGLVHGDEVTHMIPENPESTTINIDLNKTVPDIINSTEPVNITDSETLVNCTPGLGSKRVQIVDDIMFSKIMTPTIIGNTTGKNVSLDCVLVLFYSRTYYFSCMAAYYYNALPRFYPDIKMIAVDAMLHSNLNAKNGIVGVPTVMLFANGKPVAKLERSDRVESYRYDFIDFFNFLKNFTGIDYNGSFRLKVGDFLGPVPYLPAQEPDFVLIFAWIFVLGSLFYLFSCSKYCKRLVEMIQNTWRESVAQHEHSD